MVDDPAQSTETSEPELPATEGSSAPRRRVLPAIALFVAVLALAAGGYAIKTGADERDELRGQVRWLSSDLSSLESELASLGRQVSDLDYELWSLESDVTTRAMRSELIDMERELSNLSDDVCGSRGCSFRFGSIDSGLEDLTDCVNSFIDAWANNDRAYYCG